MFAVLCLAAPTAASTTDAALRTALQRDLNQYLSARSKIEHISAISLSISLHGQAENINVTAGRTQYSGAGLPVTPDRLWQIGSNTKAFTAAAVLQLEAERKLTIDQTVGYWLPQYPAWKSVTIRRLLSMTSGIPSYESVPAMLRAYAKNRKGTFSAAQLISYVYPGHLHAPPPTSGWSYSNTNYLLAELIIERASHNSYGRELERRFFESRIGLTSTYYSGTQYPPGILDRIVFGYFFDHDSDAAALAPMLGTDVHADSVSWLKAAGGIVSTPEDLARWARALYTSPMLAPRQRAELLSLVSTKTGKPIEKTSLNDPRGFGLGVVQITQRTGTFWFYEGATMGYRMVHLYFPRQDVAIAFGLNSHPDSKQDHSAELGAAIYATLHTAKML